MFKKSKSIYGIKNIGISPYERALGSLQRIYVILFPNDHPTYVIKSELYKRFIEGGFRSERTLRRWISKLKEKGIVYVNENGVRPKLPTHKLAIILSVFCLGGLFDITLRYLTQTLPLRLLLLEFLIQTYGKFWAAILYFIVYGPISWLFAIWSIKFLINNFTCKYWKRLLEKYYIRK